MRLRALEKPTATPTKVDGKCGPAAATCLAGTVKWDNGQTACGTTRKWHCEGSNGWTTAYNCPFQNPACYSCKGTYTWDIKRVWKHNPKVVCLVFQNHELKELGEQFCLPGGDPEFPGQWWISDPTADEGKYTLCDNQTSSRDRNHKPEWCSYACKKEISQAHCKKEYSMKDCSSLDEFWCKIYAYAGCRWEKN